MINEYEEVFDFIKQQGMEESLLKLKNCKPIYRANLAFLTMLENRRNQKDFSFEYNPQKDYYIFIIIEDNPNFCKMNENANSERKHFGSGFYQNKKKLPYFDFDYTKFIISLIVCHRPSLESDLQILSKVPLNRENTLVSHSTMDSVEYYKEAKNITTHAKSALDIEGFINIMENYFVIEIENRRPEKEITLKEDGILNVVYILTKNQSELIELYTLIKYSIFYIKQSLVNYISKYLYDIVFNFTHLPNENLIKFMENFGIIITKNDTQKVIFPLKQKMKSLRSLYYQNKINYLNKQMPNIRKAKNITSVPFYKFIKLINKYDLYFSEKDLKIKQSHLKKKKKYSFLNTSCVFDEKSDNISKEHKLNLHKTLSDCMGRINENLKMYTKTPENLQLLDKFMLSNLNKYIIQYTSYKGFMNIDIILNEDSMVDLQCCKTKKLNNSFNKFAYKFLSRCLNCCNLFFNFNEGFFHKHFNVLDYSYNFNEKNVIHLFPSAFDSSKKNKIRIYDIPFNDNWACLVGNLILLIWKEQHGLGKYDVVNSQSNGYVPSDQEKLDSQLKFLHFYSLTLNTITEEFFNLYEEAFPDFYLFCNRISKFPLNKYNCIDNLCQHFTNSSIQILLKSSLIFFQPFDLIYDLDRDFVQNEGILSHPNLNTIIEPYLIYIDKELYEYIEIKEKKEQFLEKKKFTIDKYLIELKTVNSEKINYNLILGNEDKFHHVNDVQLNEILNEEVDNKDLSMLKSHTIFSQPEKYSYNFSFLLNLSYYFTYKHLIEVKDKIIDYCILKRYLLSMETSQTLSFDGYEGSVLKDTPKSKTNLKKQCKKLKALLVKNFQNINKIKSYSENMLSIFYNYIKYIILKIKSKKNMEEGKNTFIKIGYFLINFNTIEEMNPVDKFMQSDYFYNFINYEN